MTYILRRAPYRSTRLRHFLAPEIRVRRVEKTRVKGQVGPFTEVEGTGQYRTDLLNVIAIDSTNGAGQKERHNDYVQTTAAEVKKKIRRLRPQEAEAITECDAVIADLQSRLNEARVARAELVAAAWQRAHVVTLKEIEEMVS